ncbi:hypothetical protein [Gloeobacter morelensis]|uniref:Uncharacterized protein n=1 Tax=Gloeobacter morelensis MG652769 TaxID=2781736 RepID=A0ABY3PTS7_9CYAN|nr:hypothetical protein [Gloeobacter morelensis]UFP97110.1 hypothetical protein ISF26_23630 [Gloeobacter morelensis MG652769]
MSTQRFERYDQILQRLADTTINVGQAVEELRAANRRQEAINDYLIRRDQERGTAIEVEGAAPQVGSHIESA